jgi:hypothetical protein
MRIVTALLLVVLASLPAGAGAELPASPSLTPPTRIALDRLLARAGYPEVGWNSISITLTASLGMEPRPVRVAYRHRYGHLPLAWARSTRSGRCMAVTLVAWYASGARRPIELRGVYCPEAGFRWRASSQSMRSFRQGEPGPRMPPPSRDLLEMGG